jgi:hypothetical protein
MHGRRGEGNAIFYTCRGFRKQTEILERRRKLQKSKKYIIIS